MKIRMFLSVMTVVAVQSLAAADEAEELLKRWSDALIGLQVNEFSRQELRGGVLCPACGFLHGRICDVAYPFAHLYATTGDDKYIKAANAALDWCERNMLLPDGLYRNDRQTYWRSTTAFFAISLWKALHNYGDKLPEQTRAKWRRIFLRSAESAYNLYEGREFRAVANYYCVYPELMYLAWRETGEKKYHEAELRMADWVRTTLFDEEGFLIGEGNVSGRLNGRTQRGCAMVDLGYNLEESLTALIEYANLSGDAALREKAVASAKLQLAFVLPDGAIDNSCGSRSVKWTYYGSRTSDGILTLLTLLRDDVPYAAEMARRVVRLYSRCTQPDGLIAGGLMYGQAGEPACTHHAFARAKTLVDYVRSGLANDRTAAILPREERGVVHHYKALDAWLVSIGKWRATISANDGFNSRRDAAVSGGTISMLWHENLGAVAVGTLGSFYYAEPHNMQDDRHDMKMHCLAPRIVAGRYSNIFDYETTASGQKNAGGFIYSAKGRLANAGGEKTGAYEIDYGITEANVKINVRSEDGKSRFVFPIVADLKDEVRVEGNRATIRRGEHIIELKATAPIALNKSDRGDRIWSPVGGMLCAELSVDLKSPVSLTLTIL